MEELFSRYDRPRRLLGSRLIQKMIKEYEMSILEGETG